MVVNRQVWHPNNGRSLFIIVPLQVMTGMPYLAEGGRIG